MTMTLKQDRGLIQLLPDTPSLRMLHTGDLCPVMAYEKPFCDGAVEPLLGDFIALADGYDAVLTNLESPLGVTGAPILKGGPNFRVPPAALNGLKKLRLTHACLANNHVKDFGPGPIAETLALLPTAGILPIGIAERYDGVMDPVYVRANGLTVALINAAEAEYAYPRDGEAGASCLNEGALMLAIRRARESAQAVVLRIHAGREYAPFPPGWLQGVFRRLVDAGADLVVADHPHVPQGIERRGRGLIVYSMGNFVFDFSDCPKLKGTRMGYAVGAAFSPRGLVSVALFPYAQQRDFSVRLLPDGAPREAFFEYLDRLSAPLPDGARTMALWEERVRRMGPQALKSIKDLMAMYPPDAAEQRRFFRNLCGAFFTCRTHLEDRRLYIRLGYEERTAAEPGAAAEFDAAAAALDTLEALLNP